MITVRTYEGTHWDEPTHSAKAARWKTYWTGKIKPHIGESVLEVGSSLGSNIPYLLGPEQKTWLAVEPDPQLAARIPNSIAGHPLRGRVKIHVGFLKDIPAQPTFDTIIYIDVLEHIENDLGEMEDALSRLLPGGKIIVLSPAYQTLYTAFDTSVGHYRRYNRATLKACTPASSRLVDLFFIDSVGTMASLANKWFLHQSTHTPGQIQFWDKYLVGASILIDPLLGFSVGKSIIGVWIKDK